MITVSITLRPILRIHSLVIFLFFSFSFSSSFFFFFNDSNDCWETHLILTGTIAGTVSLKNISNVWDVISSRYLCINSGLVQAQKLFPCFVDVTGVTFDSFYNHRECVLFRFVPHVYEHIQGLHQLRYIVGIDRGHRVLGKIEHEDQRQRSLNKNFLCFLQHTILRHVKTESINRNENYLPDVINAQDNW